MLATHVKRYLRLRNNLGYQLRDTRRELRHFARFAGSHGDTHVTRSRAIAWAGMGPSPYARNTRMRRLIQFARFLHAEDPAHEVPPIAPFEHTYVRPLPYIYSQEEIRRLIEATARLRKLYPLRRQIYATLIGLVAVTGLRQSEALDLKFEDILTGGILRIRKGKNGKERMIPLHPTTSAALSQYLELRRRFGPTNDEHVFFSFHGRRISSETMSYGFRRVARLAKIAPDRPRRPRLHDLRHTFATRALEKCATDRQSVAQHFVALATYLGHDDISQTYWYFEATPELMREIATVSERLALQGGGQ